jgi:hypothetical protein
MLTMFFAEPHYHVRMWSATSLRGAALSWADVVSYESSRRSISGLAGAPGSRNSSSGAAGAQAYLTSYFMVTPA